MGWDVVHDWMLTGRFEWRVPLRGVVHTWQHKGGRPPMDWWGIQYYSRLTLPTHSFVCELYYYKKTLLTAGLILSCSGLCCHVAMLPHQDDQGIDMDLTIGILSVNPQMVPRTVHKHTDYIHTYFTSVMIPRYNLYGGSLQPAFSACVKGVCRVWSRSV